MPEPLTTPLPEIAKCLSSHSNGQTEDGESVSGTVGALRANDSITVRRREPPDQTGRGRSRWSASMPTWIPCGLPPAWWFSRPPRRCTPCAEHERAPSRVVEVRCRKVVDPVMCPAGRLCPPEPGDLAARRCWPKSLFHVVMPEQGERYLAMT